MIAAWAAGDLTRKFLTCSRRQLENMLHCRQNHFILHSAEIGAAPPRRILPSDLPSAIKHLSDQELDQLEAAVTTEQQRRGKKPPAPEKTVSRRTEAPMTQSKASQIS